MIMGHENANGLLWTDISISVTKINKTKKCRSLFLSKQLHNFVIQHTPKKLAKSNTDNLNHNEARDIAWQKKKKKPSSLEP